MTRANVVEQILFHDPVPHTLPCVDDRGEFQERYPGGFAPIGMAADGGWLRFSPVRIMRVGEGLSDHQFRRLCESIVAYQQDTIVGFGLQWPADLVIVKFFDDEPDDATVLLASARRLGLSLVRFLGADRRPGAPT